MNKIKKSFIFCLILTLLLSNSVFAAENKNGFVIENGKTYYYQNGVKVTNKQKKIGKYYYYFNNSGVMKVNGFKILITKNGNKKKCYYNAKGRRVSGKKKIDGDIYYFNKKTGKMIGRIMNITYINQMAGVRKNGKWIHTDVPKRKNWAGYIFGYYSCGITSCAMAITYLRGKLTSPWNFNHIKYGFNGKGSNWNVGILTAKKYSKQGLKGKVKSFTKKELIEQLLKGHPIVCWVTRSIYGASGNMNGGNTGSGGGHFILIHGYKDGKFAVADPSNESQTYLWSKKLQTFESFNSHLGNGKNKSYCVIYK